MELRVPKHRESNFESRERLNVSKTLRRSNTHSIQESIIDIAELEFDQRRFDGLVQCPFALGC
jgi:hypothetical protein